MKPPFNPPGINQREEAFEAMFKHFLALAGLYRGIKHAAPEQAIAGERVAAYLTRNKEAIRAEVMKP